MQRFGYEIVQFTARKIYITEISMFPADKQTVSKMCETTETASLHQVSAQHVVLRHPKPIWTPSLLCKRETIDEYYSITNESSMHMACDGLPNSSGLKENWLRLKEMQGQQTESAEKLEERLPTYFKTKGLRSMEKSLHLNELPQTSENISPPRTFSAILERNKHSKSNSMADSLEMPNISTQSPQQYNSVTSNKASEKDRSSLHTKHLWRKGTSKVRRILNVTRNHV